MILLVHESGQKLDFWCYEVVAESDEVFSSPRRRTIHPAPPKIASCYIYEHVGVAHKLHHAFPKRSYDGKKKKL